MLPTDPRLIAAHLAWWHQHAPAEQWSVLSIPRPDGPGALLSDAVRVGEAQADHWRSLGASLARARNPYVRLTTCSVRPRVPYQRGSAAHTGALLGVWADIDVAHADHAAGRKGMPLPPDQDAALDLLAGLPAASLVTSTGGGLHAWWRLQAPLLCTDAESRSEAADLARAWSDSVVSLAAQRGWHCDGTGDLARVLRPAGSARVKAHGTHVVTVVRSGPDYHASDLQQVAAAVLADLRQPIGTTAAEAALTALARTPVRTSLRQSCTDGLAPWHAARALPLAALLADDPAGDWVLSPEQAGHAFLRSSDRWEVWTRPGADAHSTYSLKLDRQSGAIIVWSDTIARLTCRQGRSIRQGDACDPYGLWCALRGIDSTEHARWLRQCARGTESVATGTDADKRIVALMVQHSSAVGSMRRQVQHD